jgi:hypothetical protein
LGAGQQENLLDILTTYSTGNCQFHSCRLSGLCLPPSLPLAASLRHLELQSCQVGEKDLVTILGETRRLRTLALINCRETFMSGNFLSSPAEVGVVRESLAGLRSLCLDSNKYLSDVLLMRLSAATPVLEHLRSVPLGL